MEIEMEIEEFVRSVPTIEPFYIRKYPYWKRMMDICGSIALLILLSPLLIAIFFLIKLVSPGPALFKQERVGYGGKKFKFYKFRTMKHDADTSTHRKYLADLIESGADGEDFGVPMYKIERDTRVFPLGNILRKSYLDEMPQLINVLRGEMSLVGPRPPIPYEVEKYSLWHNGRFDSMPGMTGLWQISGKNKLTFKEMVRLDIKYSRQVSFWRDCIILLKTPIAIILETIEASGKQTDRRKGVEENA